MHSSLWRSSPAAQVLPVMLGLPPDIPLLFLYCWKIFPYEQFLFKCTCSCTSATYTHRFIINNLIIKPNLCSKNVQVHPWSSCGQIKDHSLQSLMGIFWRLSRKRLCGVEQSQDWKAWLREGPITLNGSTNQEVLSSILQ